MKEEDIKKTWNEAAERIYSPSSDDFTRMFRSRKESALERLARKYRRFSFISIFMICYTVIFCLNSDFFTGNADIIMAILFAVFFATASSIDYWLYRGVKSIDCYSMTVEEVVNKAFYYRRRHLQSMILLIPMSLIVLGMMIYFYRPDRYMVAGIISGAIFGGAIGIRQYLDFMSQYRELTKK